MASRTKPLPPEDYDPVAPLTEAEIKRLRPAPQVFAELGIPVPRPIGRPKADTVKRSVTIRMDQDVVDYFKASGPGWQTRMHEVLAREARKTSA
jgi:uncharacterized protein (DUF4415 family)